MSEPIHVISLGGGVQSSVDALRCAKGEYQDLNGTVLQITAAIFADTQAEPASVMTWLRFLEEEISRLPYPFPIYRVSVGSLESNEVRIRRSKKSGKLYMGSKIPAFLKKHDGKMGLLGRKCTADYKIVPIQRKVKELLGIKRSSKNDPRKAYVRIGISTDEAHRMKPSRVHYIENVWPLIDSGMSRNDCLKWAKENGYPEPPRSSCVFCPFHGDAEWKRLKDKEPLEFARAARFEVALQEAALNQEVLDGVPFLHSSGIRITDVDFEKKVNGYQQLDMFGNECEGLCGV